jgi:hypothetical protein
MVPMQAKIAAYIAPLGFVVVLLISTLLIWAFSSMFGGKGKFGALFSASAYASLIMLPSMILTFVIVRLRGGPESIQGAMDLQWTIGPAAFIPTDNPKLFALLSYFNLFAIWDLIVTIIAVQKIALLKRNSAIFSALIPWLLGLALAAGFARK